MMTVEIEPNNTGPGWVARITWMDGGRGVIVEETWMALVDTLARNLRCTPQVP